MAPFGEEVDEGGADLVGVHDGGLPTDGTTGGGPTTARDHWLRRPTGRQRMWGRRTSGGGDRRAGSSRGRGDEGDVHGIECSGSGKGRGPRPAGCPPRQCRPRVGRPYGGPRTLLRRRAWRQRLGRRAVQDVSVGGEPGSVA